MSNTDMLSFHRFKDARWSHVLHSENCIEKVQCIESAFSDDRFVVALQFMDDKFGIHLHVNIVKDFFFLFKIDEMK